MAPKRIRIGSGKCQKQAKNNPQLPNTAPIRFKVPGYEILRTQGVLWATAVLGGGLLQLALGHWMLWSALVGHGEARKQEAAVFVTTWGRLRFGGYPRRCPPSGGGHPSAWCKHAYIDAPFPAARCRLGAYLPTPRHSWCRLNRGADYGKPSCQYPGSWARGYQTLPRGPRERTNLVVTRN